MRLLEYLYLKEKPEAGELTKVVICSPFILLALWEKEFRYSGNLIGDFPFSMCFASACGKACLVGNLQSLL